MKRIIFLLIPVILILAACAPKSQKEQAKTTSTEAFDQQLYESAKAIFGALPKLAENSDNPITPEKIVLGQTLYFDTRLSNKENISCNTCHDLKAYGVDNLPTSPGDEGGFGDRNSPTVLNAAFHFVQFWDGRAKDVEEQAGGPILNPIEMAMPDQKAVIERLSKVEGYQKMFAEAFPGENRPINFDNIQKAIAAFERQLITPSRFDDYINGKQDALTTQELSGLKKFMDLGCTACHNGTIFGGNMYQKFGLMGNYWDFTNSQKVDDGRYLVTKNEADKFLFKVPGLRNIEHTHPYFHDGSIKDLGEAIRIMGITQLDLELSEEDVQDMLAFMKSLTGSIPEELTVAPPMPK